MALKHKSTDADNSYVPKRSHKQHPLSEKVDVLDLIRKGEKLDAEVTKMCGRNKSICEIVKKEKETYASFTALPQLAKVMARERSRLG